MIKTLSLFFFQHSTQAWHLITGQVRSIILLGKILPVKRNCTLQLISSIPFVCSEIHKSWFCWLRFCCFLFPFNLVYSGAPLREWEEIFSSLFFNLPYYSFQNLVFNVQGRQHLSWFRRKTHRELRWLNLAILGILETWDFRVQFILSTLFLLEVTNL